MVVDDIDDIPIDGVWTDGAVFRFLSNEDLEGDDDGLTGLLYPPRPLTGTAPGTGFESLLLEVLVL